jgi:hypothetical protein
MRRPLTRVAIVAVVALASCTSNGDPPAGATANGATATGSVTGSPSPTGATAGSATSSPGPGPLPEPDLQLPMDAPTSVVDPADVALIEAGDHSVLIPPGAEDTIAFRQTGPADPIDQIAVAWRRGSDPFAPEVGLVVWQRSGPDDDGGWRAVYAFTDRPNAGVLGLRVVPADLTADGIDDLLTEEQRGGSGACATWRVIASADGGANEIFRRDACDTEISAVDGSLEIREAVYDPGDPHCCPSAYRTTVLEWGGQAWVKVSSELEPAG